jgi:two-component system chemotaxis sensor kinase CheA
VILRPSTPLPAARALVVIRRLGEHGQVLVCAPDPTVIGSGGFAERFQVTLATQADPERLARLIAGLPDVLDCRPEAPQDRRHRERRGAGERRGERAGGREPAAEPAADAGARPEAIGTIRVATERMDRLLDGIGELILDRERLKQAVHPEPGSAGAALLEAMGRTVDAVRGEVMAMRLIPFASIVPRLQRTVRDLAQRLGKAVDLAVEGTDVLLDRSILEEMIDPLQHILRNSIDHGIEDAAGRRAAGKPPAGRIAIGLSRREDRVRLTVGDDGRGIDPAALRRVALERRFVQRQAAEAMSDEEALMLITIPGFSTAVRTTDISGRGVGMDVVRTRVQNLGGRLTIESRLGAGTRFEMDLPLTIAVTRAFLCRSAGEIYAVPVAVVQTTLEIRSDGLLGSQGRLMLRREDDVVTIVPLGGVLSGQPAAGLALSGQPAAGLAPAFPALLYQVGRQSYALAVDEILGESEIVVKPLRHPLELLPQYAGAAILNDGRIALILDPASLTRASRAA